jgi:hypothetical protein
MKNRATKDNRQRNPAFSPTAPKAKQRARKAGCTGLLTYFLTDRRKTVRGPYTHTESVDDGSGGSRMDSTIKYNEDKLRHPEARPDQSQLGQFQRSHLLLLLRAVAFGRCCLWHQDSCSSQMHMQSLPKHIQWMQ